MSLFPYPFIFCTLHYLPLTAKNISCLWIISIYHGCIKLKWKAVQVKTPSYHSESLNGACITSSKLQLPTEWYFCSILSLFFMSFDTCHLVNVFFTKRLTSEIQGAWQGISIRRSCLRIPTGHSPQLWFPPQSPAWRLVILPLHYPTA